jgi:serine/threonine protein kinase
MAVGLEQAQGELYCPSCEQMFADGERCPNDNTRLVRLSSSTDSLIGREIDKRYTILAKLGQGGMGAVYRAQQHSVGREVAIKVVAPRLVSEPIVIKRFLREAKLASKLAHPNAVSVLEFGQTDDGLLYLVMELIEGRTLEKVLETEGVLSPQRLVRIGMQICDALEGAHQLQIIHRDLKPQNVMILKTGRDLVKVLDFGLAKSLTPDPTSSTVTHAGAMLGTPAYMPPELVTGFECDGRADLYSLGCLLYVAATKDAPFKADSVHELMAMHATEPPPPLTNLPPKLAAVIARMLEKDPEKRYQTAGKARDALEASLERDYDSYTPPVTQKMPSGPVTSLGWEAVDASDAARTMRPSNNSYDGDPLAPLVPPAARSSPSLPVARSSPSLPVATTDKRDTDEDDAMASHPTLLAPSSSNASIPRSGPNLVLPPYPPGAAPVPTVRGHMAPLPPPPRTTQKVRDTKSKLPIIVIAALAGVAFAVAAALLIANRKSEPAPPPASEEKLPAPTPPPTTTPAATPPPVAPAVVPVDAAVAAPPPPAPPEATPPAPDTKKADPPRAVPRPPRAIDKPDPKKKPPTPTEPKDPPRLPVIVNPGVQ